MSKISSSTFHKTHYTSLAEAYSEAGQVERGLALLTEGEAMVQSSGGHYYEAEVYRLMGELLLKQQDSQLGAGTDAEACLRRALDVARRQGGSLKAVKGYGRNRYLIVIYQGSLAGRRIHHHGVFRSQDQPEENRMATLTKKKAIRGALSLARQLGELPATKLWLDYDAEAAVLYISIKRPQKATDTVEADGGSILLHYRGKDLVGITVLDASKQ